MAQATLECELRAALECELRAVATAGVWLTLSDRDGTHVRDRSLFSFSKRAMLPLVPVESDASTAAAAPTGSSASAEVCCALRVVASYLRGHALDCVAVRPSLIVAAGRGLFATAPIASGALICVYSGRVLTLKQVMELSVAERDYVMGGFGINKHVDASGETHAGVFARYINDNWNVEGGAPNVEFVKLRRQAKALVVASRRIEVGEELYARYGAGYWSARGVVVAGVGGGGGGVVRED